MSSYAADFYIDAKTLDWATREDCPPILNDYVADILVSALGIDGDANTFCKCRTGGYNLSWILASGNEYMRTFSEEELLDSLRGKVIDLNIKTRDSQEMNDSYVDSLGPF